MESNQIPRYKFTHLWTPDLFIFTKKLNLYNGEKKASSITVAGITGCHHVEEWK